MGLIVTEPFTYADGALTTRVGTIWAATTFNDPIIVSNQVQRSGAGGDQSSVLAAWSGSTTDQYSEIKVVNVGGNFCGPVVHMDASNNGYLFEGNINGTQCRIAIIPAYTTVVAFNQQIANGDIMYLEWVAGVLTVKVNAAPVVGGSGSDSSIATGKPGFRLWGGGGSSPTLDDFKAGDFSSGVTYPRLERGRNRGVNRGIGGGLARSFVRKDRIFVPHYASYPLQEAA